MSLRNIVHVATVATVFLCTAVTAHASSPEVCAPTTTIDRYRFLRQLSLDLRGRIPTIEEYRALDEVTEVPDQLIDEMLESEEFYATAREYHRHLIWPQLENFNLALGAAILGRAQSGWFASDHAQYYRGMTTPCLDVPQTQFDAEGRPIPTVQNNPGCPPTGCKMDGYVGVEPYWLPGTTVKVCAFDAMAQSQGLYGACDVNQRGDDPLCGCGPHLRWCVAVNSPEGDDYLMRAPLVEEPLRIFDAVIRENRPYFDALTTKETYINGPLAHFYKYIGPRGLVRDPRMGALPDIPFTDTTFVRHEREGFHSGIFTTLGYLIRFQTNRARADRFYSSFLCKPFTAPVGGLPPATDPCSSEPNVSERCGCTNCHATLEPAAAHWGRWANADFFGYLDPARFSPTRQDCATCAAGQCPEDCSLYYVTPEIVTTAKERPYLGMLRALEWRTPEQQAAVDQGPAALVAGSLASGELARCSARTMVETMLQRDLTDTEMLEWVPELANDFAASNYNFKELVRAVVHSELYREIR